MNGALWLQFLYSILSCASGVYYYFLMDMAEQMKWPKKYIRWFKFSAWLNILGAIFLLLWGVYLGLEVAV